MVAFKMSAGALCVRDVVVATGSDSVLAVATLMRTHHVGAVVLVEEREGVRVPTGIVTDRDIVLEGVVGAFDRLPQLTAGDLVTRSLVTVREIDPIDNALEVMRSAGVRRLPVVDDEGGLVGIMAIDDLVEVFSARFASLAGVIANEQDNEHVDRP